MTKKEIIDGLKFTIDMFLFDPNTGETYTEPRNDMDKTTVDACKCAIEFLEQEPCGDCISREAVADTTICEGISCNECGFNTCEDGQSGCLLQERVDKLPSVTPQPKIGRCKDCKYFEYDSVAEVHGIPLIVAHEICKRWGDGCQSKEDGYCFLFEPKMQGVEE